MPFVSRRPSFLPSLIAAVFVVGFAGLDSAEAASCTVPVDGACPTIQAALNQAAPGNDQYGNGLTGLEPEYDDLRHCQERIAKAGRTLAATRVKQLQKCRNALNRGRLAYFDAEQTMPLTNPADCASEYKTLDRMARAGRKARDLVTDECTDTLVSGLAGACATTVDGVVNAGGDAGCLVDGHEAQTDAMITGQF